MHQQVALVASSLNDGHISAWDVQTGTLLATYKTSASPRNSFCRLGRDYLLASQLGKGSLHFWTWHKDHVLQRAFTVEPMQALAASADGMFVAGGGSSGTIYIWAAGSGQLLRSWPAHCKAVTALVFSQHSGGIMLSGGEDTVVSAWLLMDVLDASLSQQAIQQQPPTPLYTWSEHTLPISSIHVGAGHTNAIAVTASLDRSCKIWSLAQGTLLRSLTFPAAIHKVITDLGDHALYAGAADGRIFETSLVGEAPGVDSGSDRHEAGYYTLEGHSTAVACLATTTDANQMVSGTDDGVVTVWDLRSRQPIRTLQKAGKGPVTGLLVMDRPPFLAAGQGGRGAKLTASAQNSSSKKGPQRPQPLAPFSKYHGNADGALDGLPVVLDGINPHRDVAASSGLAALHSVSQHSHNAAQAEEADAGSEQSVGLIAENEKLHRQLEQAQQDSQSWRQLHLELHNAFVHKLLKT